VTILTLKAKFVITTSLRVIFYLFIYLFIKLPTRTIPTVFKAVECSENYISKSPLQKCKKMAPMTHTIADAILFTMGISASLAPALKDNN